MECDRCEEAAVMRAAYSGNHLCEDHLQRSIVKRVRRRIREDGLLGRDVTPDEPETWVIGLSGGKDSAVLTDIVYETFAEDPRVELVALTIHEGIEGYRDASVEACEALVQRLGIRHEVVAYEEEYGIGMDDLVEHESATMAPCAYCGVLRRDALSKYAEQFDADKLLTGHNLDDEAQTAMMNYLSGDVSQMAKHFEASLGPFPQRIEQEHFVPRAKPLRDIPEREVALYAHLSDLPAHMTECPHASEAYRGEIQRLLHELEDAHPGTRHSIMAGYEELAAMAAERAEFDRDEDLTPCERCGSMTGAAVCRKCKILAEMGASA